MSFRTYSTSRFFSSLTFTAIAAFDLCNPMLSYAEDVAYHISDKQHLSGDVKWDYLIVDAANRHLFITHSNRVDVFDLDKKQIVGEIPHTAGVHGVALAAGLDRGFTSNGKDNSVTIFALSSLKIIGSVRTEKKPDGIVYDIASKRVFVANGESASLTPIDAVTNKALSAIPLGGKPEFVAVDGNGRLFVKNQLLVVDTAGLTVTHRYDLSGSCNEPAGLSIDLLKQRLFVGCHNQKMLVLDANSGAILDTLPIGKGSDATAYDAVTKLAFSSNSDGTLNVIGEKDVTHYQNRQTVTTMPGAKTMAIDPDSHQIYLLAAETAVATAVGRLQEPELHTQLKPDTLTLITVSP